MEESSKTHEVFRNEVGNVITISGALVFCHHLKVVDLHELWFQHDVATCHKVRERINSCREISETFNIKTARG